MLNLKLLHTRIAFMWLFFTSVIMLNDRAFSQQRPERTLDEIKAAALKRAENGMYPLIGLDPADVREAFQSIKTKDKDEWASAFMAVADRYMTEAKALEKTDPTKANADYIRAWRLYSFGRWPVPASPGKQRSYAKALKAFLAHARFWDPPLEWFTSLLKIQKSPAIFGFQKMRNLRCRW